MNKIIRAVMPLLLLSIWMGFFSGCEKKPDEIISVPLSPKDAVSVKITLPGGNIELTEPETINAFIDDIRPLTFSLTNIAYDAPGNIVSTVTITDAKGTEATWTYPLYYYNDAVYEADDEVWDVVVSYISDKPTVPRNVVSARLEAFGATTEVTDVQELAALMNLLRHLEYYSEEEITWQEDTLYDDINAPGAVIYTVALTDANGNETTLTYPCIEYNGAILTCGMVPDYILDPFFR